MYQQIKSLTGIRGVAAVMVLWFHLISLDETNLFHFPIIGNLIKNGDFGVDMFFVLSGFILTHVYMEEFKTVNKKKYFTFIYFRLSRIYPLHILTMLLMLGCFYVGKFFFGVIPRIGESAYSFSSIVANTFLVNAWLEPNDIFVQLTPLGKFDKLVGPIGTPNGVAWSISVEFLMYLLFPFVCLLLNKLGKKNLSVVILFVLGLGLIVLKQMYMGGNLLRILSLFPIGMAFYLLRDRLQFRYLAEISFVGLMLVISFGTHTLTGYLVASLLTGVLFASLYESNGCVNKFLSSKWMVYLGEISFSIYMVHWVIWSVTRNLIKVKAPFLLEWPVTVIMFVTLASVVASHISYRYFESPIRIKLKKYMNSRSE